MKIILILLFSHLNTRKQIKTVFFTQKLYDYTSGNQEIQNLNYIKIHDYIKDYIINTSPEILQLVQDYS